MSSQYASEAPFRLPLTDPMAAGRRGGVKKAATDQPNRPSSRELEHRFRNDRGPRASKQYGLASRSEPVIPRRYKIVRRGECRTLWRCRVRSPVRWRWATGHRGEQVVRLVDKPKTGRLNGREKSAVGSENKLLPQKCIQLSTSRGVGGIKDYGIHA